MEDKIVEIARFYEPEAAQMIYPNPSIILKIQFFIL